MMIQDIQIMLIILVGNVNADMHAKQCYKNTNYWRTCWL